MGERVRQQKGETFYQEQYFADAEQKHNRLPKDIVEKYLPLVCARLGWF